MLLAVPCWSAGWTVLISTVLPLLAAPLCQQMARRLAAQLHREAAAAGPAGLEVEALFQRYALDTVAAVALGIDARAVENPHGEMALRARALVARPSPWGVLLRAAAARLGLTCGRPAAAPDQRDPFAFFARVSRQEMARRRAAPEHQRDDALQLLLEARGPEGLPLPEDEVVAQCVMLFLGGYGNTAAALAWSARCLAHHPHVQERLCRELDARLTSSSSSDVLELVESMPYLDQVVREVLRLFPAATPQLARCVTAPYQLPSGGLALPLHAAVYVPVFSIHRDGDLYPEPDQFEPERFALKLALVEVLVRSEFVLVARSGSVQPRFLPGAGALRESGGTWLGLRARGTD
ncbi:probable cytochrome P450 6a13 [Pollicipes pollicipes]|uniref:probable cytochrome P450 6a13 n=1 Tax=Pollicipes pollicipes TaxID=41117 RepID=UPI0018853D60|nr:probable cytochrome P450 6a13 [Pollicipes pollicipes]